MKAYKDKIFQALILIFILYWINLMAACTAKADYSYNLKAVLSSNNSVIIENELHYYDLFHIYADNIASITFDNYDADLISPYDQGDYSDPYLYLYTLNNFSFPGINAFSSQYILVAEDDDGNEDIGNGLFFYYDDFVFTNQAVAIVTSYDPDTIGTVDFNIYSDETLTIVPEPYAISFAIMGGLLLLMIRQRK